MGKFVSTLIVAAMMASPALAQTSPSTSGPSATEIEKGIGEAARSLEALSRMMAVMGPSLSRAMEAAGPGLGRAVEKAQPSLNRAMAAAQPHMRSMGDGSVRAMPPTQSNRAPTGADMAATMQAAAASLEGLSRMMGAVAPDLGKAYDAAAPELRSAVAAARPALEDAMKAVEPQLRQMAPVPDVE
jgi:hypothetical protein